MQASFAVLKKNLKNFPQGVSTFASQSSKALATMRKIKDRQYAYAPESVRDVLEVYESSYQKRGLSQTENMWVDKELSTVVSQKELAELIRFKLDAWRLFHATGPALCVGAYSLPFYGVFLANDTHMPSTFNADAKEREAWLTAQDLYRYKYTPLFLADVKWFVDYHTAPPADKERAWDDMWEKNDVRRDPKHVRIAASIYDIFIPMHAMRRRTARLMARSMGLPTFPLWAKLCIINRLKTYWELTWNEDYMVMRDKSHLQMNEQELHDFAWRRFLAPYDKNLTQQQVMTRVEDYFEALGEPFMESGNTPNIHIMASYCLGYYNDPSYLVDHISTLEDNDYENLSSWGKDAYLRRLEFENGPLRDQVEAHTQRQLKSA